MIPTYKIGRIPSQNQQKSSIKSLNRQRTREEKHTTQLRAVAIHAKCFLFIAKNNVENKVEQ